MLYPPYILTSRGEGGRRVMLKVTFGKHEPCVEEEKSLCTLAGPGFSFLPCKRSDAFP